VFAEKMREGNACQREMRGSNGLLKNVEATGSCKKLKQRAAEKSATLGGIKSGALAGIFGHVGRRCRFFVVTISDCAMYGPYCYPVLGHYR
jgi:hypothetical protein